MAFQYKPIGHFRIRLDNEKKRTINMAYIVENTGLSYAHLIVHLVPGSKTQWTVSERFTGMKISDKSAENKDTAVREAIARIKIAGRLKVQQAIANCS